MNQTAMLMRILDILNQKIAMGAGSGMYGGICSCEAQTGAMVKRRKAGVSAGVMAGKKRNAGVMAGKRKGTSPWIAHVKKYAKDHNITYGEALSRARKSYRK